jgi:hypothetical protein
MDAGMMVVVMGAGAHFENLVGSMKDRARRWSDASGRAMCCRQTTSFIEISIEAGKLLGGKHEACFVLGVAGIEPMPS